jgi:hypothetical protein
LRHDERAALLVAGQAGTLAVVARPRLLGLAVEPGVGALFTAAAIVFSIATLAGIRALLERSADDRPSALVAMYVTAFVFWLPVFVFRSPFAAVGGLVIAHGLQYLLLTGLIAAGGEGDGDRTTTVASAALVVLGGAAVLSIASHLHASGPSTRWLYGAYVGLVASHFVVDAGLWRLRDAFPRRFLASRLPYLLSRSRSVTDIECRS